MGLRGPKPVNVDYLKGEAASWASFFYTLRDGQSGHMQRVRWGAVRNTGSAKWTAVQSGRGRLILPPNIRYRLSQPLGPVIKIPVSATASLLPPRMKAKGWVISRPVMPDPHLWALLKQARSVEEVRKVSRQIRKWMNEQIGGADRWLLPGQPILQFCEALELYAKQVLAGKCLPCYAKTNRPSSDDKRVQFIAKVLAGARYGLAPISAAKRLSHWRLTRDWAEKTLDEYVEWSRTQFPDQEKKGGGMIERDAPVR